MGGRIGGAVLLALVACGACEKAADVPVVPGPDAGPGADAGPGLDVTGSAAAEDGGVAAGARLVVLWDARREGVSFPLKYGEGVVAQGRIAVHLDGPPPDLALVQGAVGVGNLVVVADDATIPDGELSLDDADALLQSALGGVEGTMVVYRADSSERYPWLERFPFGLSCARATAADGLAALEPTDCVQVQGRLKSAAADGSLPFAAWQAPPGTLPRSAE